MSSLSLDTDFNVTVTALEQGEDKSSHSPGSSAQAKSASPSQVPCEEDVALGERSNSLAKCRMERTKLDRLSSLITDWEEVSPLGWRGNKTKS